MCRFAALLLFTMAGIFSRLVGQDAVEAELVSAAQAARVIRLTLWRLPAP